MHEVWGPALVCCADTVLDACLGHWLPRLTFLHDRDDLAFAEFALSHCCLVFPFRGHILQLFVVCF